MLHLLLTAASAATLSVGGGAYASLQDAVDDASSGDVIMVGPGTWDGGVDLRGKDLEIISSGGSAVTSIELDDTGFSWDQGEIGRLEGFSIRANGHRAFLLVDSDIEFVDIEVIGAGDGGDRGGAVSVSGGSALFEQVRFEDASGSRGGTLYATDGAYVQLVDVTITGSAAGYGGAIYAEGAALDISGLVIEQSTVENSGGGLYLSDAELDASDLTVRSITGGTFGIGLYAGDRSGVRIADGSFSDCAITDPDNDFAGGGIYIEGDTQLSLDSVVFSDNFSTDGGALAASGASAELVDVSFDGGEGSRRGGAIFLDDSAELSCSSCDFEHNISADGGAVYLGTNAIFIETSGGRWLDNMASSAGGALHADGAYQLELSAALFESNESFDQGGALYLDDLYRSVVLEGVEFASNRTTNDDGGAVAARGSTQLTISASLLKLNESLTGSGGAIWFFPDSGRDLEIRDSVLQSNTADREGGAIWIDGGGRLVIHDSEVVRNEAGELGGGVFAAAVELQEVLRTLFFENLAGEAGGAWYEQAADSSTFSYNLVVENRAAAGGGLYLEMPPHTEVINNTFAANTADDDGAHIYISGASARLINNIFHQGVDGGGVYGDSEAADGTDIFYNDAFENAGGDYVGELADPGDSGNLYQDPELLAYTIDGDETDDDFHLQLTSPCVDAGHPELEDKDGTRSDQGAYGGIDAAVYDDDGDGAWTNTDCDDSDNSVHPDAEEVAYDGVDQDCDGADLTDVDGDGYDGEGAGGADCEDGDPDIHPDAVEVFYDGVDQDCDGRSDYDADLDGYDHTSFGGGDCDDGDPTINPGVGENWYDGIDQDCDGLSDYDADVDGYDAEGYGGTDCNDANPLSYPGAPEIAYDGFDQDCDGADIADLDGDGYAAMAAGGLDCDDTDPEIFPGAQDAPYDGVDSDCDGRGEYDHDGDGYDAIAYGGTDCDDGDALINPLAYEIWYDGVDSDCDGWSDYDADRDTYESARYGGEDCDDTDPVVHPDTWEEWYDGVDQDCAGDDDYDQDYDGYQVHEDCDDRRPEAHPGAVELQNGLDDDCDGWAEDDDRDYDGIEDWDEWAVGTDYESPDSDGDGRGDGEEIGLITAPRDSDLDGVIDAWDTDDDGDGIATSVEDRADPDGDQRADTDVDGDGIPNYLDSDSDGDGYSDAAEGEDDADGDGIPDYVDYTGSYAGGGCAGGPGGASAALLLLVPLLTRRRLHGILAVLLAAGAIAGSAARAEGLDAHGLQVLGTTGDAGAYTRLAYPEAGALGDLDAGVVVDHAARPLVELLPDGRVPVIEQLSTASLVASGSLGSFTRLELVMPVHVVGVSATGIFSAPGDLRLGGVIPAWRPQGLRPGVAVAPSVWLPTGSEANRVGSPGISGGAVVSVAQEIGAFGWVANAGARLGRQEPDRNVTAGAGPLAGLGAHYLVTDALAFTAELAVQGESGFQSWPMELGGGARLRLKRGVWTSLGGAAGLNDAVGSSDWRALVGVGWSHRAPVMEVFVVADERQPDGDRDGDGISDLEDACPDQAETVDGFTDEDGCPELDGDGDGVPFERDLCPGEPIYPEQDPRYSDGCPKLAELSGDKIIITQSIFFEEGRATILPVSYEVLRAVSAIIKAHPELDGVLVEGHTNHHGSAELNYQLSEDRAAAVVRWLLADGVDRNRLLSKGYGFDVPLVAHDAPDAERINRRVEFTVVEIEDVPDSERMPDPALLPPR